jgi:glycerol-3-phosphate acyltransferase PlsY
MQWLVVLLAYIIGSFPTAYALGKKLTGKDIRRLGDHNVGARNAYHELGHTIGIIVLIVDAVKGYVAVQIARLSGAPEYIVFAACFAAMAGHIFPIFLRFRGGRGESTSIGICFALIPLPALVVAIPTVLSLIIWKNVILMSTIMYISLPFVCWFFHVPGVMITFVCILPFLVATGHYFRARALRRPAGTGTA